MKKITFIYLALVFLLLPFAETSGQLDGVFISAICWISILLVGVPHGAIDHVLYSETVSQSKGKFYFFYLVTMGAYLLTWLIFPKIALIIFLIISAYHFGESQLSFIGDRRLCSILSYLVWGVHILSAYITYQIEPLRQYMLEYSSESGFSHLFELVAYQNFFLIISGILIFGYLMSLVFRERLSWNKFLLEVYTLVLIHLTFSVFGLLLSFTLYFVVLHSVKVLIDEFEFLKVRLKDISSSSFLRKLLPFSILSFIGITLILMLNQFYLKVSMIHLLIIMTSIVTLPHSIVMYFFYQAEEDHSTV